jgi:cell division protein ZapA (FtsZ GTPase activity inhibitor)
LVEIVILQKIFFSAECEYRVSKFDNENFFIMAKQIRLNIGDKEYSLRVDNEENIRSAAQDLNENIYLIGKKHPEESALTHTVIAALNILETKYITHSQMKNDLNFICGEFENMTGYINNNLENLESQ